MKIPEFLTLSALLVAKVSAATSSTDLWDISQGSIVTSNSPMGYGAVSNMFGDNQVSVYPLEIGNALFADWNNAGFVATVEWQTPFVINLTGYNLTFRGDPTTGYRSIALFNLLGKKSISDSWHLLATYAPTGIQYTETPVEHTETFVTQELRFFKAEFVQSKNVYGTRIVELDAIATVPEPSSAGIFAAISALGLLRRRIRR